MEKTKISVSEDGRDFEVRCTFKRSFAKGAMREIAFDEQINWIAGYNIYHTDTSLFRYVYGYSYESDKRNAEVVIVAQASALQFGVAVLALGAALLF